MSDDLVQQLFPTASSLETATPGAQAWLAADVLPSGPGGVETSRPVLIKRIRAEAGRDVRLADALRLSHPNIVPTRRVLHYGTYLYVVRDVVRGKNLRQSLSSATGARPSPELLRLMVLPLLDALAAAHATGTAHGGVSAENVLISDEGRVQLSDFGTADPTALRHAPFYHGQATPAGDVKALGHLISAYLPITGPFASLDVRGRIEGILGQADTLADLREVVGTLERLAGATPGASSVPQPRMPTLELPPVGNPISTPEQIETAIPPQRHDFPIRADVPTDDEGLASDAPLAVSLSDRTIQVPQGSSGSITVTLGNSSRRPIHLRMLASQHGWINLQGGNWTLPLEIKPGARPNITFNISAARLSPGEYRSEIYLVYSDGGPGSNEPENWLKHTVALRAQVITYIPPAGGGKPPFPPDAPKVPMAPGCGAVLFLLFMLCSLGVAMAMPLLHP